MHNNSLKLTGRWATVSWKTSLEQEVESSALGGRQGRKWVGEGGYTRGIIRTHLWGQEHMMGSYCFGAEHLFTVLLVTLAPYSLGERTLYHSQFMC